MASRDCLKVGFFIAGKKALSVRSQYLLLGAFIVLLVYLWLADSFSFAFKFFLFLFPYIFLFISQDMFKEEVDSGALENIFFLQERYKGYLLGKNIYLALLAFSVSLAMFALLAVYAALSGQFSVSYIAQFLAGVVAGVYYLALGGLLSFSLRAGSNILLIILGQGFLFAGLLFSATQKAGLLGLLEKTSFPGPVSKLAFLALAAVIPNIIVARRFLFSILGIAALGAFFFILQRMKIQSLELSSK